MSIGSQSDNLGFGGGTGNRANITSPITGDPLRMVQKESLSSLYDRFGETLAGFSRNGTPFKEIVAKSMITPACGLASLSQDAAEQVLELLAGLSSKIRTKYVN